jgi:soluble lytic murein transglycosylase-like protein
MRRFGKLHHLVVALACMLLPLQALADVYVLTQADGAVHLSDRQPDPRFVLLMRVLEQRDLASPRRSACRMDGIREEDIRAAAADSGLDVALLYAVIEVESACNTQAVSRKGAVGLMQLMPATALQYGVTNARDAGQNIRAGSRHLRALLTMFGNDTSLALAAYNAGAGAVLSHGRKIPPFAETQRYVPAVLKRYAALSQ